MSEADEWVTLAVGVVISIGQGPTADLLLSMVSSHFIVIDHHIERLTHAIHHAIVKYLLHLSSLALHQKSRGPLPAFTKHCLQPSVSLQTSTNGFLETLRHLIISPRLRSPLWLSITSFPAERRKLLRGFLDALALLHDRWEVATFGTPSHLLSAFVAAFLSYNPSWLPSIPRAAGQLCAASRAPPSRGAVSGTGAGANAHKQSHPLFHQLCDLFGIKPLRADQRLCKVVVVGKDRKLVKQLLFVLSYFLRCRSILINQLPVNLRSFHNPLFTPQSVPISIGQSEPSSTTTSTTSSSTTPSIRSEHASNTFTLEKVPVAKAAQVQPAAHVYSPHLSTPNSERLISSASNPRVPQESSSSASGCSGSGSSGQHASLSDLESLKNIYFFSSFGPSLQASICPRYVPNFVSMGLLTRNFDKELTIDLRRHLRTNFTATQPPLYSACCLVVDTGTEKCETLECHTDDTQVHTHPATHSSLVAALISECVQCWRIGMPVEFCIMQLEDKLRELMYYGELYQSCSLDDDSTQSFCNLTCKTLTPADFFLLRSIALNL